MGNEERSDRQKPAETSGTSDSRPVKKVGVTPMTEAASQAQPSAKDDRYERFQNQLIPLVHTVLGARRTGHPDLDRHLQTLSDLINKGVD